MEMLQKVSETQTIHAYSHSEPQPVAIKTITLYADKDYDKLVKTSLQIVDFTTIAINIIDDDLAEGVETFYGLLNVRSSTQNFSVRITIEILDDEGQFGHDNVLCNHVEFTTCMSHLMSVNRMLIV